MKKKCKRKWKKRVMLGAIAAGGAYAVVKTRNAYQGIMKMVEEKDDDERKIVERFAKSYHYIGSAEEFTGAAVGAVCCSLHLEMQNARIEKDCEIELGCLMSSVVIYVPEKVHVVVDVKMRSGITRWTMENGLPQGAEGPTLYIHGVARMSSVLVQTLPPSKESEETALMDKIASADKTAEPDASAEAKASAEDLPSGGPITDDEPAENFDAGNDTVRVIHITDLDAEDEENEPTEPEKIPEPEPLADGVRKAVDEIFAEAESAEAESVKEESLEAEPAEPDPTPEPEKETETYPTIEPAEEPESGESESEEPEQEESEQEESVDEETADVTIDEDFDEDDDFAGDDKRKRLSQDQIDAILDRLADEYEERGGEE
ncbi:MAG: hypothetical protein IK125_04530 [Lachnospiraceae bacterium]|nr:hypothetical protein [Lachnospiraceae bacterium]